MHIVGVENFKWMCETSVNNTTFWLPTSVYLTISTLFIPR